MSDKERKPKPKYEAPIVVPLGGLAQGIGSCANGSVPGESSCGSGFSAYSSCGSGLGPGTTCGSGTGPH